MSMRINRHQWFGGAVGFKDTEAVRVIRMGDAEMVARQV